MRYRNAKKKVTFQLQFPVVMIEHWARRYVYPGEEEIETVVGPAARAQGFLTRNQFLRICEWKTQRSKSRCEKNTENDVREVTRLALASESERIKIGVLRLLHGVEWPTASVILHFCDARPYPILDFRALWSLGIARPLIYTERFWQDYTAYVRQLSATTGHSMRTIDRALWQYSKESQRGT